jgi:hypothetical protein
VTDDRGERPPQHRALAPLAVVGLAPRLQQALVALAQSASAQLPATQLIAKQFSDQYATLFADLARVTVPKVDLPKIMLPPLKLDYHSLFPDLDQLNTQLLGQLEPTFSAIREMQRAQFARTFANLAKLAESIWPPNWRGIGVPAEETLDDMLLDEGLCLAWVPPAAILGHLFTAGTPQQRRRIIGASWKRIALAAEDELEQVTAPGLRHHVSFAHRAVDAVLSGNHQAGQALSANLLDTILRKEFTTGDRKSITNQKDRFDIEEYPPRVALVLGGIWGAHGQYWPERGEQIPLRFSRHASAHGVSKRQYSRINAIISIMHVTALLRVIQQDLLR